jgi:hypothetical protein
MASYLIRWLMVQDKGVALCKANQVDPTNYTTQFPRLQLKAGDSLVANYTENGHVTQDKLPPDNKPHPGNYSWVPINSQVSANTAVLDRRPFHRKYLGRFPASVLR